MKSYSSIILMALLFVACSDNISGSDITKDDAAAMVKQIRSQIASWSYIAERFGISSKEIDMMSHCFRC